MKRAISILTLAWMTLSCVYPYKAPEISEEGNNYLVVDGSIIVGKYATLKLGHMNHYASTLPDDWWVEDETGVQYHPRNMGDNVDLSTAPADRSYRMVVKADGKTYSSSFEKGLERPRLHDVTFEANENEVFVNVSFSEGSEGTGFVALSFEEIYKFHTLFIDAFDVDTEIWAPVKRTKPDYSRYYCWRYLRSNKETLVDLTHLGGTAKDYPITFFMRGGEENHGDYTIKISARSVSDAEYRFQKNIETTTGGYNLFSPNPGEIAGNVRCEEDPSLPVLGYVTLSLASSIEGHLDDRFYVPISINKEGYIVPTAEEIPTFYLDLKYWPLFEEKNDNMSTDIYWGPRRCIDCVADGGSLEKPSFK